MFRISTNCSSPAGPGRCINAFTLFFIISVTLLIIGLTGVGLIWGHKKFRRSRAKFDLEHQAWSERVDFDVDEFELRDSQHVRRDPVQADVQEHVEKEKSLTACNTPLPPLENDKAEDLPGLVDSARPSMQSTFSDGKSEGWKRVINGWNAPDSKSDHGKESV